MHDYVPGDEARKMEWLGNFAAWMNANGTTHGFTSAEISDFVGMASLAPVELLKCVEAHDAARAATVSKKAAINRAIGQARAMARRLQAFPDTTDSDRAAAGITVPDTNPTPTDPEDIFAIAPPLILLDFSIRRQVTVHWGPNPGNEQRNGRPAGTRGCQIFAAIGGVPTAETDWIDLGQFTRSPYIHVVKDDQPTTYAYRARYVGHNLRRGPFGHPAVCTVSV